MQDKSWWRISWKNIWAVFYKFPSYLLRSTASFIICHIFLYIMS